MGTAGTYPDAEPTTMESAATAGCERIQPRHIWSNAWGTAGRTFFSRTSGDPELTCQHHRPRMRTLHNNRTNPLRHHQSHMVSQELFNNNRTNGLSRPHPIHRNNRAAIQSSKVVLNSSSRTITPLHHHPRLPQADHTFHLPRVDVLGPCMA
jgi:hypothetical protein